MTSADRYIAFLLHNLPKIAATGLYSPGRWLPMRWYAVLGHALRRLPARPGIALEFGVYNGASLRFSARKCPDRMFYGFDSFSGFPADGRPDWQQDYAARSLPAVPRNCRLLPGWFEDTIPAFLRQNPEPVAFVTIDCDIYSSARTVLFGLRERLLPGTVLYFDELINYDTFLWNEMLALFEFLEATGLGITWLATHCRVRGVAEAITSLESGKYPSWPDDVAAGYRRPVAAVLTAGGIDPPQNRDTTALAARFRALSVHYDAMRTSLQPLEAMKGLT